jgi:hypothetical protein
MAPAEDFALLVTAAWSQQLRQNRWNCDDHTHDITANRDATLVELIAHWNFGESREGAVGEKTKWSRKTPNVLNATKDR